MRTRVVKWLCVAVLFAAFVLSPWIPDYEFAVRVVICMGAAVVAMQAFHFGKHRWTASFVSVALVFNPAIPLFPLANTPGLIAIVLGAAAFAVSLTSLKSQPLLSIPSITDRNPGSESL